MIDTHCHLWDKKYEKTELEDVIKRAWTAGIKKMLVLGCNRTSSRESINLALQYSNIFAAIGTHPSDAKEFSDESISEYRDMIGDNLEKIKAIGEIGLDYHYPDIDKKAQWKTMEAQIGLAQSTSLPIVIHCRDNPGMSDAYNDCFSIVENSGITQAVYHCFSGTVKEAQRIIERGMMLSFTGTVTYPNAQDTKKVVSFCPLENMMTETDSPYLPPQSRRGERNEPAYITEVIRTIAEIKNLNPKDIAQATTQNAEKFFNF